MSEPIWIGVDIGTQSIRAIAVSDSGVELASHSVALKSIRAGVTHEQSPEDWLGGSFQCISAVTSKVNADLIKAVSISATSGTVVVVDENGDPVSP